MTRISALPLMAALLATGSAFAATTYKLDKIVINGLKSTDPATITVQLKDQPGARVTTDDILADQDQLEKLLESKHIVGAIKTSLADKHNGHIDVIFDVDDQGVQTKVVKVAPKLKDEVFTGNKKLTADQLEAASGLKPGEELSDQKIKDAQTGIAAAYNAAKIGASVSGSVAQSGDGVEVTWTIVETKVKKKQKKIDDEGGFTYDQAN